MTSAISNAPIAIKHLGGVPSSLKHQRGIESPKPQKVIIPDLFVSFVAQRPKPNPYYEKVKRDSEEWMMGYVETLVTYSAQRLILRRVCHWTEKEYKKHIFADFPYFAAVWSTEASEEEFRTVVDWCNWVFDFDDRKYSG